MTYNWDKTYPNGATVGMDKVDNDLRAIKEGVEAILATEHTVSVSTPTAITAKHAKGSAVAGYDLVANKPVAGDGITEGRLFVASANKQMYVGTGAAVEKVYLGVTWDVVSGTVEHDAALPLPTGFLLADCKYIVSVNSMAGNGYDLDSIKTWRCYVHTDGKVKCFWTDYHDTVHAMTANYFVIGIKA